MCVGLVLASGLLTVQQPASSSLIVALALLAMAVMMCRSVRSERELAHIVRGFEQYLEPGSLDTAARASARRLRNCVDIAVGRLELLSHRAPRRHGVTGLPTREPLIEFMELETREQGQAGLLAVIELVDFERLYAFDIATADQALRVIAERIERMVGKARALAHVDRARFAIWFGTTSLEVARAELDAICYALCSRIVLPDAEFLPQIRCGLADYVSGTFSPAELLARAVASLTASDGGAKRMPMIDPSEAARQEFGFEQNLRQAIARKQLELWFQPFINVCDNRICGAEALLRWHHPETGIVSPSDFIPVVEAAGLAEEFGLWTLNSACRQARQWERDGLRDVKVAVNLSAHQLQRSDLDQLIERTLQRHGLKASLLEIELTETVAALDSSSAKILFEKLRALGVSISIDDFGAGYSSLSYLKKLSFDKLKIDREFVQEVDRQRDSQAICQSIIALGRGLGIAVLAEGVERREEFLWLRRHGCTLFQGFYFAAPLPVSEFARFARDRSAIRELADLTSAVQQTALNARMK